MSKPVQQVRYPRQERLLKAFDERADWPGLPWFAKKFGITVQAVQWTLMKHRRERYLSLRHPTQGVRNDLK